MTETTALLELVLAELRKSNEFSQMALDRNEAYMQESRERARVAREDYERDSLNVTKALDLTGISEALTAIAEMIVELGAKLDEKTA